MYGKRDIPFRYEDETVLLEASEEKGLLKYRRVTSMKDSFEKTIITSSDARIVVNPVEPVNLPKKVTNYLEIEFPPLVMAPNDQRTIHLTFPLEIGVIVFGNKDMKAIDIFSYCPQKYSLYGPAGGGLITKWHRSDLYQDLPVTDRLCEGILNLRIQNKTSEWQNVSRVVLDGYAMKIYFSSEAVRMFARMKLMTSTIAETEFQSVTSHRDVLQKSIELYHTLNIPKLSRVFTMEWGFD
ncbi:hypothetical protein AZH53_05380 [Methanomicrobiaceae archaeon CYW5]|uniref:DUF432 domain-containing protein n=1 Tax=Methanovulcanius yangii TaxID=1789227 RepID=UPI0029CA7497|nr:DUF432 domain-containing protein [Methanovulcanius yangii]MBT8507844.1 hypothetical protein [Methanovulcanius yangii]